MQAIRVHEFGGPDVLRLEEIPRPDPGPDDVLIRVHTAGVLPADWKVRAGLFRRFFAPAFPYIPGSAMAGVVAAVGAHVTAFEPGQVVFGRTTNGAYAEYTTTSTVDGDTPATFSLLAVKPDGLSFEEAATISGGATTAWMALFADGGLQAGQRVLVHAGAGGVGLFAVQFAHRTGARVIATASARNVEFVRSLGADTVLDYTSEHFDQAARDIDLVLDTVGGETLRRSFDVVRPGGTLVTLLGQPVEELGRQHGIRAMKNTALPNSAVLRAIAEQIVAGEVRAVVGQTFALAEARQAHAISETGHGRGRIVLHAGATP